MQEFQEHIREAGLPEAALQREPFDLRGHVIAQSPSTMAELWPLVQQMRSVHHVMRPLHSFSLSPTTPLLTIEEELRQLEIPELRTAVSFRVTSNRSGEHDFTSVDMQRVAGAALVARHQCAVDLTGYEINVRVDLYDQTCVVALQLTREALSKRSHPVYQVRAALKANVAYALLRFAGLQKGQGGLLDPFCGSGTILLEAAQLYPHLDIYGSDTRRGTVAGVQQNVAAQKITAPLHLRRANACYLHGVYPAAAFRAIVTNPPYGMRLGKGWDFYGLYERFLRSAWQVLEPDGRIVLLVWKRAIFNRILRRLNCYHIQHVRVVETGGLYPAVFVLQRRDISPDTAA